MCVLGRRRFSLTFRANMVVLALPLYPYWLRVLNVNSFNLFTGRSGTITVRATLISALRLYSIHLDLVFCMKG